MINAKIRTAGEIILAIIAVGLLVWALAATHAAAVERRQSAADNAARNKRDLEYVGLQQQLANTQASLKSAGDKVAGLEKRLADATATAGQLQAELDSIGGVLQESALTIGRIQTGVDGSIQLAELIRDFFNRSPDGNIKVQVDGGGSGEPSPATAGQGPGGG